MKKINLKGISEVLSEKELKNIMAGSQSPTDACKGKSLCDSCNYISGDRYISGKCSQNAFYGTRYCSDLNCHY